MEAAINTFIFFLNVGLLAVLLVRHRRLTRAEDRFDEAVRWLRRRNQIETRWSEHLEGRFVADDQKKSRLIHPSLLPDKEDHRW